MKKQPLHIPNNSKGQLSAEFFGNIPEPIYQQSCAFLQNAVVVPSGAVRKRQGTRYVCPALQGADSRLVAYNGRVMVFGKGFFYMLNGMDVITATRSTQPYFTTTIIYNAFDSDVLVSKTASGLAFHGMINSIFTPKTSTSNYFVDRENQTYDTYIHYNTIAQEGLDTAPTQTDLTKIQTTPDLTGAKNYAYHHSIPLGTKPNPQLEAVLKIPYDVNMIDFSKAVVTSGGFLVPIEGKNEILLIKFDDVLEPQYFDSDIIKEYRILKVKDSSTTSTNSKFNVTKHTYDSTGDVFGGGFDKVYASTIFQNRYVIAYKLGNHTFISFSSTEDPLKFTHTSGTPNPPEAFRLRIDKVDTDHITMIHEFGNALIIGTSHAIFALQNGGGGIAINGSVPISLVKISDFGAANLQPVLHSNKLYLVGNDLQSMLQLEKNPFSRDIESKRILTYGDSIRTNGYIKKIVFWQWDYQFIGALMSDGNFLKANLDNDTVNFNQWCFDRYTAIDVTTQRVREQEDVLYFIVERDGYFFVEILFNHQHIQKIQHSYSAFRKRSSETEKENHYIDMVLPHYIKKSTHADCSVTIDTKASTAFNITVKGNALTISGGNYDFQKEDIIKYKKTYIHVLDKKIQNNYIIDNSSNLDLLNVPYNDTDFVIKRKHWNLTEYPQLGLYRNSNSTSIALDGRSFLISQYDDFNNQSGTFHFDTTGDLIINDFAEELTIGFVYRFLLVTTPINSTYATEMNKPRVIQPIQLLLRATYVIDVGVEMDKLDTKRIDHHAPVYGIQWFDSSICNYNGDAATGLIVKSDYASPVEILSIKVEYAV